METMLLTSSLLDLVFALAAIVALWAMMRLSDWVSKRAEERNAAEENTGASMYSVLGRWGMISRTINSEALPAAIYYSARWVGGCVLLGLLLG